MTDPWLPRWSRAVAAGLAALGLTSCQFQPPPSGASQAAPPAPTGVAPAARQLLDNSPPHHHVHTSSAWVGTTSERVGVAKRMDLRVEDGHFVPNAPVAPYRHVMEVGDACPPPLAPDFFDAGTNGICQNSDITPSRPRTEKHWYMYFTTPTWPGMTFWVQMVTIHVDTNCPGEEGYTQEGTGYGLIPVSQILSDPDSILNQGLAGTCDMFPDPNATPSGSPPPSASPSPPDSPPPSPPSSPSPPASASPSPPTPKPSKTPKPQNVTLDADLAFSPPHPNHLKVTAGGAWTVSVRVNGQDVVIKQGTGNKNFNWNGTNAGATLLDGTYELKVTAGDKTASTFTYIDTHGPEFTDIQVKPDSAATGEVNYTLTAHLDDTHFGGSDDKRPNQPTGNFDSSGPDAFSTYAEGGVTSQFPATYDDASKTLTKKIIINQAQLHSTTMNIVLRSRDTLENKSVKKIYPGFIFSERSSFAPTEASIHKTNKITVSQYGNWRLKIENNYEISENSQVKNIKWDGTVLEQNPDNTPPKYHVVSIESGVRRKLPDGQYTLRIETDNDEISNKSSYPSCNVSIDTIAPKLIETHVDKIIQQDDTRINYTILFKINSDGVPANDLEYSSILLEPINFAGTAVGEITKRSPGVYEATVSVKPGDIKNIKYKVSVNDIAGNSAFDTQEFSSEGIFSGFEIDQSNICSAESSQAYSIMNTNEGNSVVSSHGGNIFSVDSRLGADLRKNATKEFIVELGKSCVVPVSDTSDPINTPFYWVKEPRELSYGVGLALANPSPYKIFNNAFNLTVVYLRCNVYFDGENDSQNWFTARDIYLTNSQYGLKSYARWNGKRNDTLAPTGKYKVTVEIADSGKEFTSPSQRIKGNKSRQSVPGISIANQNGITGFRIINNDDGISFPNYNTWLNWIGQAGPFVPFTTNHQRDHEWHHIVEQFQKQYGSRVYSSHNTVRMDYKAHDIISGYYSSHDTSLAGNENGKLRVRDWLMVYHGKPTQQDFDYQWNFGMAEINKRIPSWTFSSQSDKILLGNQ